MGKNNHSLAGGLAVLCVFLVVIAGIFYTHSIEQQTIHAIAQISPIDQLRAGDTLQAVALQQNDLLIIYGSSEVVAYTKEFGANIIFQDSPTGFTPFIDANAGLSSLNLSQTLAAMGSALKGKKVIISFTPTIFFTSQAPDDANLGNFSNLHGLELVYSDSLSMDLKARIAGRMLDYPDALQNDPILLFGATHLASDKAVDRLLYYLAYPLGRLDIGIIQAQDDYEVINYIQNNPALETPVKQSTDAIAWDKLVAKAEKEQIIRSNNNSYGVNNGVWTKNYQDKAVLPPGSRDDKFLQALNASKEWDDFDAMLQLLKEEGAQPLILGRPINGNLYNDYLGVSQNARQVYYNRLSAEVGKYGFPLVDFRDHDLDKYFSVDANSHSSSKGWVYVDEAINDFYHDQLSGGY